MTPTEQQAMKDADNHDSHDIVEAVWLKILAALVRQLEADSAKLRQRMEELEGRLKNCASDADRGWIESEKYRKRIAELREMLDASHRRIAAMEAKR